MLGQILEHVGCETRHAKGDADVLVVETTVQSALSCETTLDGDDTDLVVLLCFSCQGRFLRSLLQTRDQVRNKEGPTMLEHQIIIIINFIYTLFPEKKLCSRVFTTGTLIKQTKNIINDAKS